MGNKLALSHVHWVYVCVWCNDKPWLTRRSLSQLPPSLPQKLRLEISHVMPEIHSPEMKEQKWVWAKCFSMSQHGLFLLFRWHQHTPTPHLMLSLTKSYMQLYCDCYLSQKSTQFPWDAASAVWSLNLLLKPFTLMFLNLSHESISHSRVTLIQVNSIHYYWFQPFTYFFRLSI